MTHAQLRTAQRIKNWQYLKSQTKLDSFSKEVICLMANITPLFVIFVKQNNFWTDLNTFCIKPSWLQFQTFVPEWLYFVADIRWTP